MSKTKTRVAELEGELVQARQLIDLYVTAERNARATQDAAEHKATLDAIANGNVQLMHLKKLVTRTSKYGSDMEIVLEITQRTYDNGGYLRAIMKALAA